MPFRAVDLLSPLHQRAVVAAASFVVDEGFQDLRNLPPVAPPRPGHPPTAVPLPFDDLLLSIYLPRRYALRYTERFLRQFVTCLVVVGEKLVAPSWPGLACVAEELALRAILSAAVAILETQGQPVGPEPLGPFTEFEDQLVDDLDFENLFWPARDGLDASWVGARLGMASLNLDDWFAPFYADDICPLHPFLAADPLAPADE